MTFISQQIAGAGKNIGNSDLTILSTGTRKLVLGGALSTDNFSIRNSADSVTFLEMDGTGAFELRNTSGIASLTTTGGTSEQVNCALNSIGNIGTAAQNCLKVYSRLASSAGIAQFFNSTSVSVFEFRQSSGHALLYIKNSTGTNQFEFNASGNFIISDSRNIQVGTSTGTKIGTATTQLLGFWNATPIAQPTTAIAAATFVANTSGIVDDTATFDGYTIGQVVKALRNEGLLA